ncbi:2OG-Fe dioxygenase family protein [Solilutibacter silvestris]|uniref:2OG-Fe dioxygenase family protein n=1 Tax=Solilutibacter silvestris TaxID=1645665 RepID=UPI003D345536
MSDISFPPPYTPLARLHEAVRTRGFAVLSPADVAALAGVDEGAFDALLPSWNHLEPDGYLRDGGRYRRRRHSSFIVENDALALQPHRAHWQPVEYNALHGGMQRWFEPIEEATLAQSVWSKLLLALASACSALAANPPHWHVEAHQFRIDTADGIGRPTPEGAHRDGVDFVAVLLVGRVDIIGGETRVFDVAGPDGQRFTLDAPWSLLFMEDARVIHESTPIRPRQGAASGHRDTLVVTYRASGFLGSD